MRLSVLPVLACAQLLIALDHNVMYVALPTIARAMELEPQSAQWIVSAYALAFGGFLLFGGRVTDVVGPRRAFLAALGVYGVASAAGGASWSPTMLIAARAAQGIGAALLFPATLAALYEAFPGSARARALATWGAAGACGGAFGSVLGGALIAGLGWRAVLLVNVPIAMCIALAARSTLIGAGTVPGSLLRDLPTGVVATATATLAVLTLAQGLGGGWPADAVAASAAASVSMALALCLVERHARTPLLLRRRELALPLAIAFLFMAAFGAQFYVVTTHVQSALRLSGLAAGAAFLPLTLAILLGTQAGGRQLARSDAATTTAAGLLLGAAGMGLCALGTWRGVPGMFFCGLALDGLGQGIAWTGLWALAANVGGTCKGAITGMVATAQQIGGAMGLALLVAIVGSGNVAPGFALAAFLLLAGAISSRIVRMRCAPCPLEAVTYGRQVTAPPFRGR